MIDYTKTLTAASKNKTFDEGLRKYMLKVYNYMALALLLTGVAAVTTISVEPIYNLMFQTGFGTIIMFAPLGIALYFFMGFGRMNPQTAQILFWVYAGLTGMSLAYLALIYTGASIARTFFICSSVFGAMSLYGYSTSRDLTSMGSFFAMGLIGLIIASLVNFFLKSSALSFATSLIGIVIFMGLIAWDTQKIKSMYYMAGNDEVGQKLSVMAAFTLYLDFINLFLYLMRFLGNRRD
ncbi:Bax inhibitor-1/YccA family protein [Rickettsia japonica]|uniref:Bax inhibitor-1/YccA family protein n=2 Tax=Rickettsia japonica TaxID=35790 RepID=A0AAD1CAI9_RICJA|nr:Bax inhibitor-1/YccA family protein [Rickettsia japonica]AXU06176.1 Bax inhibitor-1/YccA family protein [Rickettsia japonica]QHE24854.1 BAX inhibitor (BI)-1/YccA family protein [Rickettsia japonica]BAK96373.1 Integral membrane protein [Rickettsia japonica YH]BAW82422.1 integral membrane protein [Rickettsia japonica]